MWEWMQMEGDAWGTYLEKSWTCLWDKVSAIILEGTEKATSRVTILKKEWEVSNFVADY